MMLLTLLVPLSICMTGCAPRYAVVDGSQTISVPKSVLDNYQRDNSDLLQALEQCRAKKP